MSIKQHVRDDYYLNEEFDVVVIGGGNAGLVVTLALGERGRRVLLLEKSSVEWRGGNTKFTRDFRFAHRRAGEIADYVTGDYDEEEFLNDIIRVTKGKTNVSMAKIIVERSLDAIKWVSRHKVRWQKPLRGTLHLSRTNIFILGGGKAMVNAYYYQLERMDNVKVMYDAEAVGFDVQGDTVLNVIVRRGDDEFKVRANSYVIASGGFESNIDLLRRFWGKAADNIIIRGTENNDGRLLFHLIGLGADAVGDIRDGHMTVVLDGSPRYNGGIVTRVDSVPFSIVVNKYGVRFYDEGEDVWPKRYAIWGKLVAEQPDQIAFSIFDDKVWGLFIPPLYPPIEASSLEELAKVLEHRYGVPSETVIKTIHEYNRHVVERCIFNPQDLDDCRTVGLEINKSHWASKIEGPRFLAYPLRPGLTFTYYGLRVDEKGRVLRGGKPFTNLFASGEIMMGNILSSGYLGGLGLTIGTVMSMVIGDEL